MKKDGKTISITHYNYVMLGVPSQLAYSFILIFFKRLVI